MDKRIAEANIDKGLIVLLTGNGKGKSSSAFGMVCRTLGYDKKVVIVKFLKGEQQTGEDKFFNSQPNVQSIIMQSGFTWDTQDKNHDTQKANETWQQSKKLFTDQSIDLIVLDELTYMLNYKYLDEKEVIDIINNRHKNQHIIITGRAASKSLIDIADTVSEIKDIKHAFRNNIKAQFGIDI